MKLQSKLLPRVMQKGQTVPYAIALLLLILTLYPKETKADTLLSATHFKEISFSELPKTRYQFDGEFLRIGVRASSSFLLYPFSEVKTVDGFKLAWRKTGKLNVSSSAIEQSKKGDDFYLRIGFLLSGKAPIIPFFAPSWSKAVANHLKLPSERIVYYVVDAKTPVGQSWLSPYSDSITYLSVDGEKREGWEWVDVSFDKPAKVVGLWLMADGDNSRSHFEVEVKKLELKTEK